MIPTGLLIDCAVKSAVLLGAAAVVARLLKSRPAAVRHLVWAMAVSAVLLLPLARNVAPEVSVPAPDPLRITLDVYGREAAPAGEPGSALQGIVVLWAAGAFSVWAYIAAGLLRLLRLTRTAVPVPSQTCSGLPGRVRVLLSSRVPAPLTWGVLRPVILLPEGAAEWSDARMRVVLAHELAHIQRLDWLTQLVAQWCCAVYWFNPLAWYAERSMCRERELACDDGVLTGGVLGSDYASHLVEIARSVRSEGSFSVGVAMARKSNLEHRVLAMLNPGLRRERVTARLLAIAWVVCAAVLLPLAGLRATAQANGGAVSGSVLDSTHAAVPGAAVYLKNLTGRNTEITRTSRSGEYAFSGLPEGRYQLEVKARGFEVFRQEMVVTAGSNAIQNAVLNVGTATETMDVVGKTPAAKAGEAPARIKVGGQVQAMKLLHMVRPAYPEHLKGQGVEGSVLLRAVIGTDGSVLSLEPMNTQVHEDLVKAAKEAVSQWKYEPTHLNGEPVEVIVTVEINFRLQP